MWTDETEVEVNLKTFLFSCMKYNAGKKESCAISTGRMFSHKEKVEPVLKVSIIECTEFRVRKRC